MEPPMHTMTTLFEQLGLESSNEAIAEFVQQHGPIPPGVRLSDLEIWTPSQATFLRRMIEEDADWAEIVDQMSAMLR